MGNRQAEKFKVCHDGIAAQTDEAICVEIDEEQIWFPLSQVHEICHDPIDMHLIVTAWIAKKKGLL